MKPKDPKFIRVAKVECPSIRDFAEMRRMAAANERIAGARVGLLGEFFVIDEHRFGLLKSACGATEIK